MKPLKKHPKQQRMEEMTFPITKPSNCKHGTPVSLYSVPCAKCVVERSKRSIDKDGAWEVKDDQYQGCHKRTWTKEKVTWEGREYLRSINDDNGFTLMPRIVWRVVAVVILVIICLVVIL